MGVLLLIKAMRVRMPHCELKWEMPIQKASLKEKKL
jgi:hypothetical protein